MNRNFFKKGGVQVGVFQKILKSIMALYGGGGSLPRKFSIQDNFLFFHLRRRWVGGGFKKIQKGSI